MTTFSRDELQQKREDLRKEIQHTEIQSEADLMQGNIDQLKFYVIRDGLSRMSRELNRLDTLLLLTTFEELELEPNSPGSKLGEATAQLNSAASHLDDVHNALLAFAAVVDALTSICSELAKRYLLPFG